MFTSNNTIVDPFTVLASYSSSYDPSPYIINHENDNHTIFFNHNNPPIIPQIIDSAQDMGASNNAMIYKQKVNVINGDQEHDEPLAAVFVPVKRPVKKDRHSKIYTAQGLRDRRVRLSIEVARKFFDLQDMLGFDKASKTLEWLMSKSRKAIKELAQNEQGAKSLSSSSTMCESGEVEGNIVSKKDDDDDDQSMAAVSGSCNDKRRKKRMRKVAPFRTDAASNLVAKQSRAKARERARERTRVKMSTRKSHEFKNHTADQYMLNQPRLHLLNPHHHHHHHRACSGDSREVAAHDQHDQQVEELTAINSTHSSSLANLMPKGSIVDESILIRRKLKPSTVMGYQQKQSTMMGCQQNLLMCKDIGCSNNNYSSPNLPQNWDINGAIARSSFCAITNMNRPAGLHVYGKMWEAENC